jgi:TRAP-type uncharacterized transport system fused permease subunit
MLQGGTWFDTGYVLLKALVSVGLWGAAASAWLWGPLNWVERGFATAAAFLLVVAIPWTDEVGFALSAAFFAWHWWRTRKPATVGIAE